MQPTEKHNEQLSNLFQELRDRGWIAIEGELCCQNCTWAMIEDNYETNNENIIFYHAQNWDYWVESGIIHLYHQSAAPVGSDNYHVWAKNLTLTIEEFGFSVEWDSPLAENTIRVSIGE